MKSFLRGLLLFSVCLSFGAFAGAASRPSGEKVSKYSEYNQLLEQYWPLPKVTAVDCQSHNPYHWMDMAQKMISVEPIRQHVALTDDEVMVLKNLLISQAYNRVFTHSLRIQNTETPQINYFWIAAGSQASVTVGHALQVGLADKYPLGSRQRKIFRRLESQYADLPVIPELLLISIDEVKNKTAENNWRVYSDLMWQHLAYMNCGFDEVVRLNQVMIAEKRAQKKLSEVNHYERFIYVWNDIREGRPREANMKLIYIEQHNILQKYMYDGLDAKAANAMLLFNSMAKADLSGPNGRVILGFTEYSILEGMYPNLGDFPTRYHWMRYVVGEQIGFIQELATPEKIEQALTRSLHESYQLVRGYLPYLY